MIFSHDLQVLNNDVLIVFRNTLQVLSSSIYTQYHFGYRDSPAFQLGRLAGPSGQLCRLVEPSAHLQGICGLLDSLYRESGTFLLRYNEIP